MTLIGTGSDSMKDSGGVKKYKIFKIILKKYALTLVHIKTNRQQICKFADLYM
jgi:hypothetical protein